MAEKLINAIKLFLGTNAERLAMTTTGLPVGTFFEETDTMLVYRWDGSAWYLKSGANSSLLSGKQISTDQDATWANSAPANTAVNVDITKPTSAVGEYMLTIYNPSTVTAITVNVYAIALTLGAGTRYSLITSLSFPANTTQSKFIHGIFNGTDVRFELKNDTILGGSDGFTAKLRLREVM